VEFITKGQDSLNEFSGRDDGVPEGYLAGSKKEGGGTVFQERAEERSHQG